MSTKLDDMERMLQERFGDPLVAEIRPTLNESLVCEGCGCMQQMEEADTCSECGMMGPMPEVDHPSNDNAAPVPLYYEIVDTKTGAVVGKAKTQQRARVSVDRRDNQYGSYRYKARPVYAK